MVKYNDLLDTLFKEWKNSYSEEDRKKFCEDGIMLKYDKSIDVDEQWEKSTRRIMFLLKDCPDGWGYDTRGMLIDEKKGEENRTLKNKFTRNLAKILYGLQNKERNEVHDKYVNEHMSDAERIWNTVPFAFIETKKLAGGKDVSSETIMKALTRDKLFLAKEIDILRPNIIVCFDGDNNIFKYITDEYFMGVKPSIEKRYIYDNAKFNCCLNYYEQNNTVVVNSYHPSAVVDDWIFLEKVFSPFRSLLGDLPNDKRL